MKMNLAFAQLLLGRKPPISLNPMTPMSCSRLYHTAMVTPGIHDTAGKTNTEKPPPYLQEIKYCQKCGSRMRLQTPQGDDHIRSVCTSCGTIFYCNPKLVCGIVATTNDKRRVLLCKRAIEPIGKWTIPAGYMENEESVIEGAVREAREEARAEVKIGNLLACYSITSISQVQLLFRGVLLNENGIEAGDETTEVKLFEWDQIPWEELAYPTVSWALRRSFDTMAESNALPQLRTKNPDGSFVDLDAHTNPL